MDEKRPDWVEKGSGLDDKGPRMDEKGPGMDEKEPWFNKEVPDSTTRASEKIVLKQKLNT